MNAWRKITIVSALVVLCVVGSYMIGGRAPQTDAAQNIGKVTGWGWAFEPDKTDQNHTAWDHATPQGNIGAGLGWIAFDAHDYDNNPSGAETYNHVDIDSSGYLHGYAYNDFVGWIQFDPAGPYPTVSLTPPNTGSIQQTPSQHTLPVLQQSGTSVNSQSNGGAIQGTQTTTPPGGSTGGTINTQNNGGTIQGTPGSSGTGGVGAGSSGGQSGALPRLIRELFAPKIAYAQTSSGARINLQTGQWSGWARACGSQNGCGGADRASTETGGWDGWISLRGNGYGVQTNLAAGTTTGHAWGDTDLGWISFANVLVSIDACDNIAGTQTTVPSGALQVGTSCDFCQNISGNQSSVPSGMSQIPMPNGQGHICQQNINDYCKLHPTDPICNNLPYCQTHPTALQCVLCPNNPIGGTTYTDASWVAAGAGHVVDPGTGMCIISNNYCAVVGDPHYGQPTTCCADEPNNGAGDATCTGGGTGGQGGVPIYEET